MDLTLSRGKRFSSAGKGEREGESKTPGCNESSPAFGRLPPSPTVRALGSHPCVALSSADGSRTVRAAPPHAGVLVHKWCPHPPHLARRPVFIGQNRGGGDVFLLWGQAPEAAPGRVFTPLPPNYTGFCGCFRVLGLGGPLLTTSSKFKNNTVSPSRCAPSPEFFRTKTAFPAKALIPARSAAESGTASAQNKMARLSGIPPLNVRAPCAAS